VDYFLNSSNFFTLDVADFIGSKASDFQIEEFVKKSQKFVGKFQLPGIDRPFIIDKAIIKSIAEKYLYAIEQAAEIYRHICAKKTEDDFVVEISMDETDQPQTPVELLFILSALADFGIPANTIAPKFTGDFYKGIDYIGDLAKFAREFEEDLMVIQFAIEEFNLNSDLKLSVHSGSDKFSIYPIIKQALKKYDAGIHIKTAGTTWLEELIGLAMAGGNGLQLIKKIYRAAYERMEELCEPYATVINIDKNSLPNPQKVELWDGEQLANTLRHEQSNSNYNNNFRQLLHVGYKIAAEFGAEYYMALEEYKEIIGQNVTENLFERHIKRIFID
jgi:tagaturonate epimerase